LADRPDEVAGLADRPDEVAGVAGTLVPNLLSGAGGAAAPADPLANVKIFLQGNILQYCVIAACGSTPPLLADLCDLLERLSLIIK
jgi:hypothetical protein